MKNIEAGDGRSRRWWVLVGVSMAGMLVALDFTIVNICLPTIQHDFLTSTNTLQWLVLGFGIPFASCLTAAGKLADRVGRRKVLYVSILVFILSSLGAGLSPIILILIIMRLFQGLSAAAIFPAGMAIVVHTFPENERVRAVSLFGSVMGIGLALGPILGGFILALLGWRWIFFINIPLALMAMFICTILGRVQESKHPGSPPIDWVGMLSMIVSIGGICFLVSQAAILGWDSAGV